RRKLKLFAADHTAMIGTYLLKSHVPTKPSEPAKTNTKQVSFGLYRAGKSVAEIAAERHLAISTIEGHLAHFIARGDLDIAEFVTEEQVKEIAEFFQQKNTDSLSEAKAHFGERFMYGQLRMVREHTKAKTVSSVEDGSRNEIS